MEETKTTRTRKHFRLDAAKTRRAKEIIGARTQTETIERALDQVIARDQRNGNAWRANERFLKSGIEIRDVFGQLDE